MDTPLFATFKPIIKSSDQHKQDIAKYYLENNLNPQNEYLRRYLENTMSQLNTPQTTFEEFVPTEAPKKTSKPTISIKPEQSTVRPTSVNFTNTKSYIDKGKQIINFFVNKGLTKEQAAGIAGNLFMESSFNTDVLGDNNSSFGIAQWHGPRWSQLKEFAKTKGSHEKDLNIQLEFIWEELQTTEKNAFNKLLTAKTARESANIFSHLYERPKFYNRERENKAEEFYNA